MADGPPFHTTQTNAVEFPGACLRQTGRIPSVFEGREFGRSVTTHHSALHPQIIAASEYQRYSSTDGAPGWRGIGRPPAVVDLSSWQGALS
jgi:hypothetical protein